MKTPSKFAMEAAESIRAYPMSMTPSIKYAELIDQSFEPLRLSHEKLVEILKQADISLEQHGMNEGCWPRKEIKTSLSSAQKLIGE